MFYFPNNNPQQPNNIHQIISSKYLHNTAAIPQGFIHSSIMKSLQLDTDPQKLVRGISKKCSLCSCQFGIITRQHICKRCLRSVCQECSNHKLKVYRSDKKQRNHRLCDLCYKEHEIIRQYVATKKLKAFEDSEDSQLWTAQIGPTKVLIKPQKVAGYDEEVQNSFWGSLNFSLRELVGLCIEESENEIDWYLKRLSSLLDKLSQKQSIGSLQSVIYLACFVSCHCSQSVTVNIICSLSDLLHSQQLSKKNIMQYLQTNTEQAQLLQLEEYLQYRFNKLGQNLGVNIMPSTISILIVGRVLQSWDIGEYQRGVAAYLYASRGVILSCKNNYDLVNLEILKRVTRVEVEKAMDSYKKAGGHSSKEPETRKESRTEPNQNSEQESNVNTNVGKEQGQKPKENQFKKQRKKSRNIKQLKNMEGMRAENQRLKKKQMEYLSQIQNLKTEVQYLRSLKLGQSQKNDKQEPSKQDSEQQQQKLKSSTEISVLRETILSKNLKLNQYKNQIHQLKYDLQAAKNTLITSHNRKNSFVSISQKNYIDQSEHQREIEQMQRQIQVIRSEKEAVNRMNGILLGKLNQLSNKIVEVEGAKMEINNSECDREMGVEELARVGEKGEGVEGGDCLLF